MKIYATDVDEEALAQARQATYTAKRHRGRPAELLEQYFERVDDRLRVPQGPAALGDLRPQRPGAGRADLAGRPAGLPQHADVLQRRDAGADPRPLPLRAARRRLPLPRQGRDAAHARRPVQPSTCKRRIFRRCRSAASRDRRSYADRRRRRRAPDGSGTAGCATSAFDAVAGRPDRRRPPTAARAGQRARRATLFGARRRATSAGRCRTWRSPTGRWSCAPIEQALRGAAGRSRCATSSGAPRAARACTSTSRSCRWSRRRRAARGGVTFDDVTAARQLQDELERAKRSSRRPTRSSSPRSRSSRPPTRSCSPPSRSSRRPTRSSSPPTRSSRR